MDLITSLLDIASTQQVPFSIPLYMQCTHHGLILLCSFVVSLLTAKVSLFTLAHDDFLTIVTGIIHVLYLLIAEALLILLLLCNELCIA